LRCEEEVFLFYDMDSDSDGIINRIDDYPCCSAPPITRLEFAEQVAVFGVQQLGLSCDTFPAIEFPDVDLKVSVQCVVSWGIMRGYADGTFQPEGFINRAEAAKMLSALLLLEDNVLPHDWIENLPEDVSGDEWYAKYVGKLVSTLLTPRRDVFRPAESATSCLVDGVLGSACALGYCMLIRADMMIIVMEALGLPCDIAGPHFPDVPKDLYAYNAIECAYENGLLDASMVEFRPGQMVQRQEAVKFIVEALDLSADIGTAPSFIDVEPTMWSYEAIEVAVDNGLLTPGGEFNPQLFASPQWLNLILARARAQNLLP
jgi:hypothetical protein